MTAERRPSAPGLLQREVLAAHEEVQALLAAAAAAPPPGDPRAPVRALDAALALLCEHLAAVEAVLHPEAARRLPDGRHRTSAADSRRVQRALRTVQQQLAGDVRAGHATLEQLAEDLRQVLAEHRPRDEHLARALDDVLDDAQRSATAARLAEAVRHAPTRPHPHLPHRGPASPLLQRLAGWWDDVLDELDVRSVEGRRAAPQPRPVGLWGSYLLGRSLPSPVPPDPGSRADDRLAQGSSRPAR